MANGGSFLAACVNYWGHLAQNATTRMQQASEEVRKREYTTGRLVSDVLGLWLDGVDGWWGALMAGASPPVPVVFFRVRKGEKPEEATKTKTCVVPVLVRHEGDVKCTDLVRLGEPYAKKIPCHNVRLAVPETRDRLEIRLVGLGEVKPEEGHYQGLVYVEEEPLAMVHVLVTA
jgi:hypothetical protein